MNTLELIHAKIHGLRMIPNYKPSRFEEEINKLIAEEFKEQCPECKDKLKILNLQTELKQSQPQPQKKSFLGGLFE